MSKKVGKDTSLNFIHKMWCWFQFNIRQSFGLAVPTLAPICLADTALSSVQVLWLDVSDDVVACAGAVHLPRGLVFSHLLSS